MRRMRCGPHWNAAPVSREKPQLERHRTTTSHSMLTQRHVSAMPRPIGGPHVCRAEGQPGDTSTTGTSPATNGVNGASPPATAPYVPGRFRRMPGLFPAFLPNRVAAVARQPRPAQPARGRDTFVGCHWRLVRQCEQRSTHMLALKGKHATPMLSTGLA